jgi:hypothetical protein
VFGADAVLGWAIGVPALGPLAVGGGVRASCLLGVKVVVVGLFSGFFMVLPLVWVLRGIFSLRKSRGCWGEKVFTFRCGVGRGLYGRVFELGVCRSALGGVSCLCRLWSELVLVLGLVVFFSAFLGRNRKSSHVLLSAGISTT